MIFFYPGSVLFAKSTPYKAFTGADPGFLDRWLKFTKGGFDFLISYDYL